MSELTRKVKFLLKQRLRGFSVPDLPNFDAEGLQYFLRRLERSRFFLEYGSGGSTVQACRLRKPFLSVESDPYYLNAVRKKIASEIGSMSGRLIHANIGSTVEWGYPLFKRQSKRRLERWAEYATIPWTVVEPPSAPDLILVDGRFRVHCTLYAIQQMQGQDFEIVFDDYADRSYYHEVEKFARLEVMHGRMAVFKPTAVNADALSTAIETFSSDYR
jgi:hypothetical protein